jgi:hypothetical protein
MMDAKILDFYRQQTFFTDPGKYVELFDALPDDIPSLVDIVQGLLIPPYSFILALHKGTPSEIDNVGFGIRSIEATVERILSIHNASLIEARPPQKRLGVNCRNFAALLVSILRHKGIAARVRVGFAGYLGGAINYEHRITEYWDVALERWVLVDAWIDDLQRKAKGIRFDILDISPDDPFYISGDVWLKSRQNRVDPNQFGDSDTDIGMSMIRYALLHDFDALNKLEVLGCDAWGKLIEKPEQQLTQAEIKYLDQVATLTINPDANFSQLIEVHTSTSYGKEVRAEAQKSGFL